MDNENAGSQQSLTSEEGTPEGTQSLNDEKTLEGLSRRVTKQSATIKELTDKLVLAESKMEELSKASPSEELTQAKVELAKAQVLIKYKDVAEKIEPLLKRGIDPSLIDDEFVSVFRTSEGGEEGAPAHNPPRGQLTPEQQASQTLKSLDSLF